MIPITCVPTSQSPLLFGVATRAATTKPPVDTFTIPIFVSTADGMAVEHLCLATLCWGGPLPDGLGRDEDVVDWLLSADFDAWILPIETGDRVHVFFRENDEPAYVLGHERDGQTEWIAFHESYVALATLFDLIRAIRLDHAAHRQTFSNPSIN